MASNGKFRNRIVEYGVKPASQFTGNPSNWRRHPERQRRALNTSLNTVGWAGAVIESARSGYLIDGHERLWQALHEGDETPVPYLLVDVDPNEESLLLATFDPIGAMAETDAEMLAGLLAELGDVPEFDAEDVSALLAEIAEQTGVELEREAPTDPGPQIDRAEELREQWQTERGQVWEILSASVPGRAHRLMCGDSTSAADVARLMQGERADCVFADPPYGMHLDTDYSAITGSAKAQIKGRGGNVYAPVLGDDEDFDPRPVMAFFEETDEQFWWGADYYAERIPAKNGGSWFVWDKRGSEEADKIIGASFELCWSKRKHKREIARVKWMGAFGHADARDRMHPTQKPIALVEWFLERFTEATKLVADPYCGSGTTMVAGERIGRLVYGCELSPAYVAVTLQRLSDMGLVARRVDA